MCSGLNAEAVNVVNNVQFLAQTDRSASLDHVSPGAMDIHFVLPIYVFLYSKSDGSR